MMRTKKMYRIQQQYKHLYMIVQVICLLDQISEPMVLQFVLPSRGCDTAS